MDLGSLTELCTWMRSHGAVHARVGELELHLGPPPPPVSAEVDTPSSPVDEREAGRRDLETLLHSSGADAQRILDMQSRMARQ